MKRLPQMVFCRIGWHRWWYYKRIFGELPEKEEHIPARFCLRCELTQHRDDGIRSDSPDEWREWMRER